MAAQSPSIHQPARPAASVLPPSKDTYVDLTVVSGYVEGLLVLVVITVVGIAMELFAK